MIELFVLKETNIQKIQKYILVFFHFETVEFGQKISHKGNLNIRFQICPAG